MSLTICSVPMPSLIGQMQYLQSTIRELRPRDIIRESAGGAKTFFLGVKEGETPREWDEDGVSSRR